jgi:hypothetical protein
MRKQKVESCEGSHGSADGPASYRGGAHIVEAEVFALAPLLRAQPKTCWKLCFRCNMRTVALKDSGLPGAIVHPRGWASSGRLLPALAGERESRLLLLPPHSVLCNRSEGLRGGTLKHKNYLKSSSTTISKELMWENFEYDYINYQIE